MENTETPTTDPGVGTRAASKTPSLKHRVIRGSLWAFIGDGVGQVMRLCGNLIMTRLLFPEAFGLMALVNVFLQGLAMFSDLGIGPSIIQNPRGEEPRFLRTAWTAFVGRGLVLWVCAALLAWPLSRFYEEPHLKLLLPVGAFSIVISGFASTKVAVLTRRLHISKLTLFNLSSQAVGLITMILLALHWRSVWALVIGTHVGVTFKTVMSHLLFGPPRMRFQFDREVARELFHFGKWLFLASILAFIVGRVDRLVLGKFMTMAQLGVYSIAFMFSQAMVEAVTRLSRRVLFPVYARTAEQSMATLRSHTFRIRRALMAVTLPPLWVLIVIGPEMIHLIYDERYHEAGWMLQILGVAGVCATILNPVDSVLLAVGNTFRHMLLQLARSAILVVAMVVGGWYYGTTGVMFGFVAASILYYPFLAALIRRYKVWLPLLDLAGLAASGVAVGLGLWIKAHWFMS